MPGNTGCRKNYAKITWIKMELGEITTPKGCSLLGKVGGNSRGRKWEGGRGEKQFQRVTKAGPPRSW